MALHHLNCPWRPADLEQRDGRILRQGNQNEQVTIARYVVTGSFDLFSWQTIERKSRAFNQVMRGDPTVCQIEDLGDDTFSAARHSPWSPPRSLTHQSWTPAPTPPRGPVASLYRG